MGGLSCKVTAFCFADSPKHRKTRTDSPAFKQVAVINCSFTMESDEDKPMNDYMNGSALQGIRVLDLGQMVAAPFCTSIMADMGADVLKIEAPAGDISRNSMPKVDGISTYFVTFNRSKRGITLNLKSDKGKEVLKKLIKEADVLVENFRPGVMKRLGFDYESVSAVNPRIVYASISGYGQKGKYADRACFDPIAQAISGLESVTGPADGGPIRCGASIADIMAGQNALIGILAALRYREISGRGQYIDCSLVDACIVSLASMNQIYNSTGKIPTRRGNTFEATAPGNTYETKDGIISISAGQTREWPKFARCIGHPEWIEDERFVSVDRRVINRILLDSLIEEETRKYTTADLMDILLEYGLPAAPIYSIKDVTEDEHFAGERMMFVDVEHPELGRVKITGQGIKMSETNPYVRSCSPLLGQDNADVLNELGYTAEEIEDMKQNGVV